MRVGQWVGPVVSPGPWAQGVGDGEGMGTGSRMRTRDVDEEETDVDEGERDVGEGERDVGEEAGLGEFGGYWGVVGWAGAEGGLVAHLHWANEFGQSLELACMAATGVVRRFGGRDSVQGHQ